MSKWREQYQMHPAADVFPMMSDEEIDDLAADIKKHGLSRPIIIYVTTKPGRNGEPIATSMRLLDGRNRMEALERIGQPVTECMKEYIADVEGIDPVAYVVGANIKRRHLTKTQQAELIVAVVKAGEKLDHDEPVSRGGRGKVNSVKAKACRLAAEAGISASTVKRVLTGPKPRPPRRTSLENARERYLDQCAASDVDLDAEEELISLMPCASLQQGEGRMPHKESPDVVCVPARIANEIDAIRDIYRSAPRCNGERHIVYVSPCGATQLNRWKLFGEPLLRRRA